MTEFNGDRKRKQLEPVYGHPDIGSIDVGCLGIASWES